MLSQVSVLAGLGPVAGMDMGLDRQALEEEASSAKTASHRLMGAGRVWRVPGAS